VVAQGGLRSFGQGCYLHLPFDGVVWVGKLKGAQEGQTRPEKVREEHREGFFFAICGASSLAATARKIKAA
jgi:hypothetical protein